MKKECTECKQEKLLSEFYKQADRKNGSSLCKSCFNKYCVNRWQQRKINAIEYKGGECIDCNVSYPKYPAAIFEFHHLDASKKDTDWNKLKLKSWGAITLELDKCVLLCANCHRIRHHNEYLKNL